MSATELLQIPEVRERLSPVSTLLNIPEVRECFSPTPVEVYHLLPERNARGKRTELIRGIIIEKMSKSPRHRWLARKLNALVTQAIGDGLLVWYDEPLTFIDSEPEPDIAIVTGNEDQYLDEHPHTALLVIEVAVTSLVLDRVKSEIYAEAGIPEYWIVDTAKKRIEVYTVITLILNAAIKYKEGK